MLNRDKTYAQVVKARGLTRHYFLREERALIYLAKVFLIPTIYVFMEK